MDVQRFKDALEVQTAASQALNDALHQAINSQQPVLLLLSGGSALSLVDFIDPENITTNTTITVLDERYSQDPAINTMAQLATTQFSAVALKRGCRFLDTRITQNETLEQLSNRINLNLETWLRTNPQGSLIATMGIGPDGHISGIMPYPENPTLFKQRFDNDNQWAVGYDAKDKNPYPLRVTTTLPLLRKIQKAIVYVTGDNKRDALDRLMAQEGDVASTPARILHELSEVTVFTNSL